MIAVDGKKKKSEDKKKKKRKKFHIRSGKTHPLLQSWLVLVSLRVKRDEALNAISSVTQSVGVFYKWACFFRVAAATAGSFSKVMPRHLDCPLVVGCNDKVGYRMRLIIKC